MPRWRARSGSIEGGRTASRRRDAPAGEGAGKTSVLMPGEEETGRAARLRREPKTPGDERCLDLDLPKSGAEGLGLQPFFQGPGCVERIARLHDENKGRVETEREQARAIGGAPFARGVLGQTPQHGRRRTPRLRQTLAENGEGEGKRRGLIAVSGSLDLMQPVRRKLVPRNFPPPGRGRVGQGGRPNR